MAHDAGDVWTFAFSRIELKSALRSSGNHATVAFGFESRRSE